MIYADHRWIGNHGIGRFARHVLGGIDYQPVPLDGHPAGAFDSYRLSRAIRKLRHDDLFFSPGYNSPLYCSAPFVFTIHDLSHVYCLENSSALIRAYYATVLKRACRRAAAILTVSEFTRNQIVEWSGLQPEKVLNVSCGVDPAYSPTGEGYGFSFPYLLCVSNRKPHKNEGRTLGAFARAAIDSSIRLVFTGLETKEVSAQIRTFGLRDRVQFTGAVDENKLPALYRGALALLFPSLYEGFGLPIVEAMASGTPVITSSVTAMPETAGDAAMLVDPLSVEEIAEAISRVFGDDQLRDQLRAKGLARAATFSWTQTVRAVRGVLAAHSG
jgi:glycosyltransferase involved in cell wall biosynthesis